MMKTIAFCMPILEGMEQHMRDAPQRWISQQHDEWRESRRAAGIACERAWIQHTPDGPVAVLAHDVEDIDRCFEAMASSELPFDVRFRAHVKAVHGIDLAHDPAPRVRQLEAWTDSTIRSDADSWAIALRIVDGSERDVADWAHRIWSHPQYEHARRDVGVQCQVLCWHETPMGAFAVIYAEGESLRHTVDSLSISGREVDELWFDGIERFTGLKVTGFDSLPRLERVVVAEAFQHAHT